MNIKEISNNFTMRNFKKYHDIYYETQLSKLDNDKLYILTFHGNVSFKQEIPTEFFIYNGNFYKASNNLNFALQKGKLTKSVVKKAFAMYGNGSISEYETDSVVESAIIKPSDMDSIFSKKTIESSNREEYIKKFPEDEKELEKYNNNEDFKAGFNAGYDKGWEDGSDYAWDEGIHRAEEKEYY